MVERPENVHRGLGSCFISGGPGCDTARSTGRFLNYRITFHQKDVIVADLRPAARDDVDSVNATGGRFVALAIREAL